MLNQLVLAACIASLGGGVAKPSVGKSERHRDNASPSLPRNVPLVDIEPNGPLCGVLSLHACLHALHLKTNLRALVTPEYIGSADGSSANELLLAARKAGAKAECLIGMTHWDLECATTPIILHVRGRQDTRHFNHWVAFLGFDDHLVILYDGSPPLRRQSMAQLLANWDGLGIRVATPHHQSELVSESTVIYLTSLSVFIWVLILVRSTFRARSRSHVETIRQLHWNALGQALFLSGISLALSFGWHLLSEVGFLRNSDAIAEVTRRYYRVNFRLIPLKEVEATPTSGIVLVDARNPRDYHAGCIPGAINIPASASLEERWQQLKKFSKSTRFIVYCQSSRCGYADTTAQFLNFNGYTVLGVYREGYREWQEMHSSNLSHGVLDPRR